MTPATPPTLYTIAHETAPPAAAMSAPRASCGRVDDREGPEQEQPQRAAEARPNPVVCAGAEERRDRRSQDLGHGRRKPHEAGRDRESDRVVGDLLVARVVLQEEELRPSP